jgi:CheY-like chemotaxis protein
VSCASPGLGQGSTFEVMLPLARTAPAAADAAPPTRNEATGAPRALHVLVVDDNVDAAETLGMLLQASGHEVAVEHSSLGALARVRTALPDVALLDIGLPDLDGNELARRLRADPATAGIALVAVTGYGQEQDRRAALASGFDHHLVKPVDMERLEGLLAEVAGRASGK